MVNHFDIAFSDRSGENHAGDCETCGVGIDRTRSVEELKKVDENGEKAREGRRRAGHAESQLVEEGPRRDNHHRQDAAA